MSIAYGGNAITFGDGSKSANAWTGFRNRIINGDMRIDQRNAGASVTPTVGGVYLLDRWVFSLSQSSKYSVQQNAGSVTPPAGFSNYLGVTSLSAYTVGASELFLFSQPIEGFNVADLGWGTANAKTVTLSFWVRSSLTGTFGGTVANSGDTRVYPFTYTINSANTWEYKTVTITGDTTGTWLTNNGVGMNVRFGLGVGSTYSGTAGAWSGSTYYSATGATSVVGTNGATFYITGVQLERGSDASSFEYRPYGTEFALCQRYFYRTYGSSSAQPPICRGYGLGTATSGISLFFPVLMRTAPTLTKFGTFSTVNCSQPTIDFGSPSGCELYTTITATSFFVFFSDSSSAYVTASAEL